MVRFPKLFDKFFGSHPRRFHKEAREQIKQSTLGYLKKFGRHDWKTTSEIFEETIEPTDLFNSNEGKMFFAEQGIKSRINSAAHSLRTEGHPIIAGKQSWKGKVKGYVGRGYKYADEDCDGFIDAWDEKFNAIEQRKENITKEKRTDMELIKRIIERLIEKKRLEEAQKLKVILVRYEN